jgi:RimJ/RimL family protein N-acetyltransferase
MSNLNLVYGMFYGKKVQLRPVEPEDLDNIMEYWNNLEVMQYLAHAIPVSRAKEREIVEKISKSDPWKDGHLPLAIEDKKTGEFMGTVGLHRISRQNRNADLGIVLGKPENYGKGFGTDAIRTMLWVAFNIIGLESVHLSTYTMNERAQSAFKSAGFKEVGRRRKAYFTMGEFRDVIIMDILKEEFFAKYPPGVSIEKSE